MLDLLLERVSDILRDFVRPVGLFDNRRGPLPYEELASGDATVKPSLD
jgi:hypothetical protein